MNKMFNFIKENYKYILFFFVLFFINLLFFIKQQTDNLYHVFIIISTIISIVIVVINYKLNNTKKVKTETIFLVCSIFIGILYVFVMPIGMAPDEAAHFRRIYEISDGHIISDKNSNGTGGRSLPVSISTTFSFDIQDGTYADEIKLISKTRNNKTSNFQTFGNTSLYSPICYIPQVLGTVVGKILHLPMIFIVYLARLFNLAAWIAIMYFSIKYIPTGKLFISLLLLSPISMQAAASCQADALTNCIAIGLISFVLYKIKQQKKLTKNEKIIMTLLAIVMSMCKIVYIPLCLLLYLIPDKCFQNKKDKYIKITGLAVFVIIINLIWLLISSTYLVEFQPGVNSMEQVKYILKAPIYYLKVLHSTYDNYGIYYLLTSTGSYLGYFNIHLSETYILFYVMFIIYTALRENNKKKLILNQFQKIFVTLILISCFLLISTSLYVQWTAVGEIMISGIQGRYFIPLIPLLLLLLGSKDLESKKDNRIYVYMFIYLINIYALMMIIAYYV